MSSALESRFAPIVEHIKRKPKTYASSSLFANMTYQNILRGEGHPGSDDAHPKTQPKQKESMCCVWVYIYIFAVCVWERERERREALFNITRAKLFNWKQDIKKSVELQINEEEVGGWGGAAGTKSYLACRSIPEVKLDRRWLRPGSWRGDCGLSAPWHFLFPPPLSPQFRRRSSCGAQTLSCIGPWIIRSCDQRPCYFLWRCERVEESRRFNLGIQKAKPKKRSNY